MIDPTVIDNKLQDDIKNFGLQVLYIMEDEQGPGFSYSIGLYESYGHPEIIMVGLKQDLMHTLINNMAYDIKDGKVFIPFKYEADILDDFECYFVEVEKSNYDAYVGQAQKYYKRDGFPLLQCIYPTVKGIYPWEDEWPESIKDLQPILGPLK
ncbi:protein of unknown function [Mucilaginibacter pineti]|uniref:DUF4262 domain-containing protein n=1 Tax=Mucilaginibacter pineti TaxID=1391627 RepID=A0A1G7KEW2_9SPHI|nr:DUF4262 domain-containing protein [Mucilaginibacter pineti]SDF35705.1 protein of unknown function [Mucilaginibacter pineti]